jgi:hypothetical protein
MLHLVQVGREPGLAEAITLNASEDDLKFIMETPERGDRANGWE